ncbi:MAG: glycosyltransferase [Propionicimonas sp.]|nr:glycosyltransferase [Propionicimonas sp.]
MRIGILTDDSYPHSGGVTRSIEQQVEHLVGLGHEVTLFAPKWDFVPPADCGWEALDQWRLPGTPSFLCSLRFSPGRGRRIAAGHDLDVVHSQNERGSLYLGALVAREAGIPHVHTFHSNYVGTHRTTPGISGFNSLTYLPLSGRLLRLATGDRQSPQVRLPRSEAAGQDSVHARRDWRNLARLAGRVDAFTSPAGYMVECIVEAGPELAGRGHVVPSGVDDIFAAALRSRRDDPTVRFVSCSRLGSEKRVDATVRAFALLDRPDAELVIIGAGPEEAALRRLAGTVRNGRVRFLGRVDDGARVAQEMADADAFVLASYHFDTQGMVLAEAAAAGAPLLYCDERLQVGVGPDNALLVGPEPENLAAGMAVLADDPARRARMSAASRALAPSLTGAAMARAYVAVYRQAIDAARP